MAPPWVKGPRGTPATATTTVMSNVPWANMNVNNVPTNTPVMAPTPPPTFSPQVFVPPQVPQMQPISRPQMPPQQQKPAIFVPAPVMPKSPSSEAPKSLASLLQQAPRPVATPAMDDGHLDFSQTPVQPAKPKPPGLKGPIVPQPAGPLAGAKFVLPPIPPRPPPKATSGKSANQIAKIAKLRSSVHPRPEDIGDLLREIECGRMLNHVCCNDRSKPLVGPTQTFFPEF